MGTVTAETHPAAIVLIIVSVIILLVGLPLVAFLWRKAYPNTPGETQPSNDPSGPHVSITLSTEKLRQAEDGSAILEGLARALHAAEATTYATQVQTAADAIRDLTTQHPQAQTSTDDWVSIAAAEHKSEILYRLPTHP